MLSKTKTIEKRREETESDNVKIIQRVSRRGKKKKSEGALRVFGERVQRIGLGRISTLGRQSDVGCFVFAQVRVALPHPTSSFVILHWCTMKTIKSWINTCSKNVK